MLGLNLTNCLILAVTLFGIGLFGVMVRRNIIVVFLSLAIMLHAALLVFLAFARRHEAAAMVAYVHEPIGATGVTSAMFIIGLGAVQVIVGLAIAIAYYRNRGTADIDTATKLNG